MTNFDELKLNYRVLADIPYSELLKTTEWFDRRSIIINRDKCCCTNCGNTQTFDHFDSKTRKVLYISFGEDKLTKMKGEDGMWYESWIPEITILDKRYSLHVHHKFYILDRLPWEYKDKDLITLCNWCHWDFHQKNKVQIFKELNSKLIPVELALCSRCNGAGWFPEYTHVENGVCFECRGGRFERTTIA